MTRGRAAEGSLARPGRWRRLAGAALAAIMATPALAACAGSGSYRVVATFDDVGDLQTRGAVQVADVRVGRIAGIRLTKDFRATVTMRVNRGVKVPRASAAVLRQTSLLGEKFIELRPSGDPTARPYLTDGDAVTSTGSTPELEFIADQAVTVLGAVSAGDVASLVQTGAEGFGGRATELRAVIDDLASLSRTLADRRRDLVRIIDGLDSATSTLAHSAPEVSNLLSNLATTTQVLRDNREKAIAALQALTRLAAGQDQILRTYRTDIDRQLAQLDAVLAVAATQSGEVGSLVDWLARFTTAIPKVIPGDFVQVYMWAIPAAQDPRVGP